MRVVLSDTEWYYGRYILAGIVVLIAVCGGVGIYYYESRTQALPQTESIKTQVTTLSPSSKASVPLEGKNNEGEKEKKGISLDVRLNDALKEAKTESESVSTQDKPRMIAVGIQGAIQKPGLYWVEEGTRLQELIDRAGGPLENAEMRYMNIAAILSDGTTVVIPEKQKVEFDGQRLFARGVSQPAPAVISTGNNYIPDIPTSSQSISTSSVSFPQTVSSGKSSVNTTGLIDLNHASQKELETLPGIGPVLAQSIISYRENQPFQSVDDLMQVSGIGPKRFEKIRHLVTVSPP